jgi:hypothetical protein
VCVCVGGGDLLNLPPAVVHVHACAASGVRPEMRRSEACVRTGETGNFVIAPAAALNAEGPLAGAVCGGSEVKAVGGAIKARGAGGGGEEGEMGKSCGGRGGDKAAEP